MLLQFKDLRNEVTSNTPDEKEPATGFAVIPYIYGVSEPMKRILNSHNVHIAQKPFQIWGIFYCQTKVSITNEQLTKTLFILFCAMTAITSTQERPNVSLVHI